MDWFYSHALPAYNSKAAGLVVAVKLLEAEVLGPEKSRSVRSLKAPQPTCLPKHLRPLTSAVLDLLDLSRTKTGTSVSVHPFQLSEVLEMENRRCFHHFSCSSP